MFQYCLDLLINSDLFTMYFNFKYLVLNLTLTIYVFCTPNRCCWCRLLFKSLGLLIFHIIGIRFLNFYSWKNPKKYISDLFLEHKISILEDCLRQRCITWINYIFKYIFHRVVTVLTLAVYVYKVMYINLLFQKIQKKIFLNDMTPLETRYEYCKKPFCWS